jgi:hypothetical protein
MNNPAAAQSGDPFGMERNFVSRASLSMTPEFYKREARRHRLLAKQEADPASAERLLQRAAEYDEIAAAMEREAPPDKR